MVEVFVKQNDLEKLQVPWRSTPFLYLWTMHPASETFGPMLLAQLLQCFHPCAVTSISAWLVGLIRDEEVYTSDQYIWNHLPSGSVALYSILLRCLLNERMKTRTGSLWWQKLRRSHPPARISRARSFSPRIWVRAGVRTVGAMKATKSQSWPFELTETINGQSIWGFHQLRPASADISRMTEASRHCPHRRPPATLLLMASSFSFQSFLRMLFYIFLFSYWGAGITKLPSYQVDPIRQFAHLLTPLTPECGNPQVSDCKAWFFSGLNLRKSSQGWPGWPSGRSILRNEYGIIWVKILNAQKWMTQYDAILKRQIMWADWCPNLIVWLGVRLRQRENQLAREVLTLVRASGAGPMGPLQYPNKIK